MQDIPKVRDDIAKAEEHITEGEMRITQQIVRIQRLKDTGKDTTRAKETLCILEEVLDAWRQHRQAILDTIARLE